MRVIEPSQFKAHTKHKSRAKRRLLVGTALLIGVACAGGIYAQQASAPDSSAPVAQAVQAVATVKPAGAKNSPKQFSANQFRDLYRAILPTYPNTQAFPDLPEITGNATADTVIRDAAEQRGFQLTRMPVSALVKTNEPLLRGETDDLLQPRAFEAWKQLRDEAQKDGVPLQLLSAYRSPQWQRDLFAQRFAANGGIASDVAAGYSKQIVQTTLSMTSVPGYSRHHTGYTVDFSCDDGQSTFEASTCFAWLSKDNYLHAKQAGWIPSYPVGADQQGPEPEAWEYVWVGRDVLFE